MTQEKEQLLSNLFIQLLNRAKTNKGLLINLKHSIVKCQQFELAAQIMEIEKECFPESNEQKAAKERALELRTLFGMVELNVEPNVCWLIDETLRMHKKKKGKFDLKDAASIVVRCKNLFD
jgi:hypothetical protein